MILDFKNLEQYGCFVWCRQSNVLKGHCHERKFKNSTAQKHVYTIENLLTVVKFS